MTDAEKRVVEAANGDWSSVYDGENTCESCQYYFEEWDGDYGQIFCGCGCSNKRRPNNERLGNLKSFPFKTPQPCFVPDFWQTRLASKLDPDIPQKMSDEWWEFLAAVRALALEEKQG